jgi:uncharacterized protein
VPILRPESLATGEDTAKQKALQRGWVKDRNGWKADDKRACVENSYRTRIVEIQIESEQFARESIMASLLAIPSPPDAHFALELQILITS